MILLPILGVTWVIGVFAIDAAFAWLFTVLNSMQVHCCNYCNYAIVHLYQSTGSFHLLFFMK